MSSISSLGSIGSMASSMSMMHAMRRPDPAKMAENLFSKLDTSGQGYLEKADLQAAFDGISTNTGSTTNVDDLLTQLDTDSDGKVTKDEFSSSMSKLAQQLDDQFQSSRMQQGMEGMMGGMGGMPPPPPPANDSGFTKDELTSQLEEAGSTDSTRASLLSSIVQNFDAADTDSDGKVSFREAMAYQNANSTTSSSGSSSASSTSSTGSTSSTDSQVMQQIMRLIQAYGHGGDGSSIVESQLSVSA